MLYLNRKPGQAVIINGGIEVKVIEIRGKTVKLGFDFPADATVHRAEVIAEIKQVNESALGTADAINLIGQESHVDTAPDDDRTPTKKTGFNDE